MNYKEETREKKIEGDIEHKIDHKYPIKAFMINISPLKDIRSLDKLKQP